VKLGIVSRWVGLLMDSGGEAIIGVFKGEIDVCDPLRNRSVCVCVGASAHPLRRFKASRHLRLLPRHYILL
jgi:hypothetical protein